MGRKSPGTNLSQGEKWFPLWWSYYQWVMNWSSFHCRLTSAPSQVSRTFCLFPRCLCQSEIHWCLPFYTLGWDVCSSMRQRGRCPDLVSIDLHSWPFLPPEGKSLACQSPAQPSAPPPAFPKSPDGFGWPGYPQPLGSVGKARCSLRVGGRKVEHIGMLSKGPQVEGQRPGGWVNGNQVLPRPSLVPTAFPLTTMALPTSYRQLSAYYELDTLT